MKPITRVKCIVPFTDLSIHHQGYCYTCYPEWTRVGNVGKLTDQNSIMDIWNGEKIQYIRRAVLDDQLDKVCNFEYCPNAIKNEYLDLEALKRDDDNFNHIIDQIMAGRTLMDKPPFTLVIANSGKCNLKCIMCTSNDTYIKNDDLFNEKLFTKILPEILPGISYLHLEGNGEVFSHPQSVKFLQSLDPNRYPSLKIHFLTNGTLFTPELWGSINHNTYRYIAVSIDAALKETYEKIRRNGNWDVLQRNLKFIAELRRTGAFHYFRINFCVMLSNYKEMKDFVKLGLSLGCDEIHFQKIYGSVNIKENINLTNNKRIFVEIGKTLTDPVFSRPEVNTTLITEYRKYATKGVYIWDDMISKVKELRLISGSRRRLKTN